MPMSVLILRIVSVAGQRDLEARVIIAPSDDKERAEAAMAEVEKFGIVHKILVFVNSRTSRYLCRLFSMRPLCQDAGLRPPRELV